MSGRTCVFCSNPAGSWEHAWPDWVFRYIGDQLALIQPPVPPNTMDVFRDQIEIHVDTVCDGCNRGWMRKLEDRVNPKLKRMMIGETTRLTVRETHALRRWAIKTTIMLESFHQPVSASPELIQALRRGDSPPHALVTLGRYVGEQTLSHHRVLLTDTLNNDAYLSWMTLVFGQVLIQVMTDVHVRNPDATLSSEAADYFVQLPPGKGINLEWPSISPITDRDLPAIQAGPEPDIRSKARATPITPPPAQKRRPRHR